jgi:transglutaminase/protease-like cytokinesis protein 3
LGKIQKIANKQQKTIKYIFDVFALFLVFSMFFQKNLKLKEFTFDAFSF